MSEIKMSLRAVARAPRRLPDPWRRWELDSARADRWRRAGQRIMQGAPWSVDNFRRFSAVQRRLQAIYRRMARFRDLAWPAGGTP